MLIGPAKELVPDPTTDPVPLTVTGSRLEYAIFVNCSVPPEFTVVPTLVAPKAVVDPALRVPPLTVMGSVKVWVPDSVVVPVPVLVMLFTGLRSNGKMYAFAAPPGFTAGFVSQI